MNSGKCVAAYRSVSNRRCDGSASGHEDQVSLHAEASMGKGVEMPSIARDAKVEYSAELLSQQASWMPQSWLYSRHSKFTNKDVAMTVCCPACGCRFLKPHFAIVLKGNLPSRKLISPSYPRSRPPELSSKMAVYARLRLLLLTTCLDTMMPSNMSTLHAAGIRGFSLSGRHCCKQKFDRSWWR